MIPKKKIYIAYTGGTIGMKLTPEGYVPVSGFLQAQMAVNPIFQHDSLPDYVVHEYAPLLDSPNMTPNDWTTIGRDIEANYDDYDGFIVLHGTDTMAYTASALAFMLENLSKPGVMTALTGIEAFLKFGEKQSESKKQQREIEDLRDELRFEWFTEGVHSHSVINSNQPTTKLIRCG